MAQQYDVVIVGAGPAGSAAAAALAQRGWHVLLLERDHFPRHKVCGEFLSPEAQATLGALDLAEALTAAQPARLTHATVTTQRGQSIRMALPGQAWGISRFAMDAALATAAAHKGVELWSGVTVKAYTKADDHYVVQLQERQAEDGSCRPVTVRAQALIMACGRHSATALPPNPPPNHRPRAVGIKCHYADLAMPAQVELFFFPGGYAGLNPVEGNRANFCALLSYEAFRQAGHSVPATLAALSEWNPAIGRRLAAGQLLPETIATVAPVDTGRPTMPWDGVACVGDTAVMLPPLCGDGMAMALRSAELCAPLADGFLRNTIGLDEWAKAYQTQWQREFRRRVGVGRLLQRALARPLLADTMIRIGQVLPPLATYFVHATRGALPRSAPSLTG